MQKKIIISYDKNELEKDGYAIFGILERNRLKDERFFAESVGKSEVDISKLEEYFEKDVFDLISNAGAIKNGVSEEIGELIFDEMVEHAPYAYSKSSAISETMSMYLSAYDKYHYSGVYFKYFLKQ